MRDIVHTYVRKFREERRERRKFLGVLLLLALAVSGGIMWQFKTTGIALTNEVQCGLEEHSHTDECYAWALTQDAADTQEAVATQVTVTEVAATESGAAATDLTAESGTEAEKEAVAADESQDSTAAGSEAEANVTVESQSTVSGNEAEVTQAADAAADDTTEALPAQVLLTDATESDDWYLSHGYEKVLVCGLEEHTHTVSCLSDETADVETAEIWEATLPTLTGVWADDVAAIAESQLGYTESTLNFTLDEDGTTRKGYTRYGAWYGNAYGDWDAMFAAFCLHYAGISEDDFPVNSGAYAWSVSLKEVGLYQTAEGNTPAVGSLVFLDKDLDGTIDAVGIITDIYNEETALTVVEGNSNDEVEENSYEISDATVAGYGVLPTQDEASLTGTMKTYTASTEDESVTVTVTAPYGALPEGAKLSVTLYEEDSDEYTAAAEAIEYNPETVEVVETEDGIALASEDDTDTETVTTSGLAVLDICFKVDGVEVEPTDTVTVSIDASAIIPEEADASTIEVQHLTENENGEVEAVLVADATEETEGIVTADAENTTVVAEFTADSFSTFTITWSGQQGPNTTTYFTITVHHVDESGNELTVTTSNVTASVNNNSSTTYTFSDYATSIDGYAYSKATYSSATGDEVTTATFTASGQNNPTRTLTLANAAGISVYTGTYNGSTVSVNVYLVYEKVNLTITDTIVTDGNINAVFSVDVPDDATVTYTWYKNGTEVEDKKVGSDYILSNDGASLNVALDGCDGDTYKVVVTVTEADETTTTYEAEYTVPYYSSLQNGSFETPSNPNTSSDAVWGNQWSNASYLANGGVWQTTGTYSGSSGYYQDIEVINATVNASSSSGYNWYNSIPQTFSNGVSATAGTTAFSVPDGVQFVELNCEASGSLYQDVLTVPGSTLNWWLYHRARGNKTDSTEYDTMYLLIMSTELAEKYGIDTQEEVMAVINNISDYPGAAYWTFTSDDQQWHYYSSDGTSTDANGKTLSPYTVPDSQYLTRFFFVAGDTASGNTTVGNFLDDVGFTTDPLPAVNGQGNLQIKKVVYGLSEEDIKDYTVTFTVYAEDGTTEVGTVTLDYEDYVAAESGTTASGIPYYTLVSYISVLSANKTTGTDYLVTETLTNVDDYTWNSTTSTAVNYYGTENNAVNVLENSTTTITYSNYYEAATTSITLKKVDSKEETPLSGAVFTLKSGNTVIGTYTTNIYGIADFGDLTNGTVYTLTETTAPDGYNLLAEPIEFTIGTDGTVRFTSGNDDNVASATTENGSIVITVKNTAGAVLPSTGSTGTYLYTLAGLLLIMSAVCLMYKNLRRKGDLPY